MPQNHSYDAVEIHCNNTSHLSFILDISTDATGRGDISVMDRSNSLPNSEILTNILTTTSSNTITGGRQLTTCPLGYFGDGCMYTCDDCINGGSCKFAGSNGCDCLPGYHGPICSHRCPHGSYGPNCNQVILISRVFLNVHSSFDTMTRYLFKFQSS